MIKIPTNNYAKKDNKITIVLIIIIIITLVVVVVVVVIWKSYPSLLLLTKPGSLLPCISASETHAL